MAVNRIVAFGCSNTLGESCTTSWPSELAKLTGLDVVNNGEPGCSGRYIVHRVMKYDFQPNDLCIIAWPEITRYCWLGEHSVEHIGVWYGANKEKATELYKKYFSDYHAQQDFYLFEQFVNLYAKQSNIAYKDYLSCYTFVASEKYKMQLVDYGDDGRHPGVNSHIQFAEKIYKDLLNETIL